MICAAAPIELAVGRSSADATQGGRQDCRERFARGSPGAEFAHATRRVAARGEGLPELSDALEAGVQWRKMVRRGSGFLE